MPGAAATNFAVQITKWTAPAPQEDPYLSEPLSPAMKRVLLELSPQSTLAAEEAQRQAVAAANAAEIERLRPPPPTPEQIAAKEEENRDRIRKNEYDRWLAQERAIEAEAANPGPRPVYRLMSEVEAEEKAKAEELARQAAEAQVQVPEFDQIAEPPAPPPLPAPPGTVMYSDPLV